MSSAYCARSHTSGPVRICPSSGVMAMLRSEPVLENNAGVLVGIVSWQGR